MVNGQVIHKALQSLFIAALVLEELVCESINLIQSKYIQLLKITRNTKKLLCHFLPFLGSFMTLDTIIKRLIDVGTVDIKTTVLKIRSQRADSVFDCELYIFCHLALIDYAVKHGILKSADLAGFEHPYWIDQFAEMVRERRRSGLVKEYSQIKSRQYVEKFVDEPSYLAKNRYGLLCLEHSRVHLSTENNDPTSNYIHANFVDGHQQTKVYIATQGR